MICVRLRKSSVTTVAILHLLCVVTYSRSVLVKEKKMPRPKTNIADASDSGECSGTSKTYNTRRSVVDSLPYDSRGYLQIDK